MHLFSSPHCNVFVLTIIGIVGLVIGSFINTAAFSLISQESFNKCRGNIAWYNNIAVLSHLLLRTKWEHCKEEISFQNPLVEIITAMLILTIFVRDGISIKTLFLVILVIALVLIMITGLKNLVFDITSLPLIPLGLLYSFFNIGKTESEVIYIPIKQINYILTLNQTFVSAIIGILIGVFFFEFISRLGLKSTGERTFGSGNTLIGAALGAWFGWKMLIIILALSFVCLLIIGIPIALFKMYKDKDYTSLVYFGIFLFLLIIPYIGRLAGFISNSGVLFFAAISISLFSKRIRNIQKFSYLPYSSILAFLGLVLIFWNNG